MAHSTRVVGIDSSTQSTKAVLVDAADGTVLAQRSAPHPDGTSVDPRHWLKACDDALGDWLGEAAAVAVAGQQHGMVALDADGEPVHDALLWNDTRSADAAVDLVAEMGGPQECAAAVGSVLVASFTASKLRWLRDHRPEAADRTTQVLLPHDYVSWHLAARRTGPFTDRGDASGTGYFDARTSAWREDLAAAALGHEVALPRVVADGAAAYEGSVVVAGGTGDNMGAALGLGLAAGDVVVSIGTSGVASAIAETPVADGTGSVTGFADATGRYLPMATTMNAAGILDLQARLLGVDHAELGRLALAAPPGANGVTLSPYYGGERTPDRPHAVGVWDGLRPSTTREDLARAAVEALLCSLADAVDLLRSRVGGALLAGRSGGDGDGRLLLIGGAARNPAVRALAPAILGMPVHVPPSAEYVALGAARQAAWALSGAVDPPTWEAKGAEVLEADPTPAVREAYADLRDRTGAWTRPERTS
ncbi:xylulokinase [Mumia zhuanghuii]|uniref:Xylulose kinase n=1 Tax=Mumia zhuanghuii TaxID=2585211 RepID=A0A5Q6S4H8_9ACTN|nr:MULTISPECIES: xylulokinase [Mumia]KAA1425302.1 xylulokinase [Mumia zhuanghuii]